MPEETVKPNKREKKIKRKNGGSVQADKVSEREFWSKSEGKSW